MIFCKTSFIKLMRIGTLGFAVLSGYSIESCAATFFLEASSALQSTDTPGATYGGIYHFINEESRNSEPYILRTCFTKVISAKDINQLKDWRTQPIGSDLIVTIDVIVLPQTWKEGRATADMLFHGALPSTDKLGQQWGKHCIERSHYSDIEAFLPTSPEEAFTLYAALNHQLQITDNVPQVFFDYKRYFVLNDDGACFRVRLVGIYKTTTNSNAVVEELRDFIRRHIKIQQVVPPPKPKKDGCPCFMQ